MGRQGDFGATANRRTIDGADEGLAAAFHAAELARQRHDLFEHDLVRHVRGVLGTLFDALEVGAGEEGFLAGGQDDALDGGIGGDTIEAFAQFVDEHLVDGVHGAVLLVDLQRGNAVGIDGELEYLVHLSLSSEFFRRVQ